MASIVASQLAYVRPLQGITALSEATLRGKDAPASQIQRGLRSSFAGQAMLRRATKKGVSGAVSLRTGIIPKAESQVREQVERNNLSKPLTWQQKLAKAVPADLPRFASTAVSETIHFFQRPAVIASLMAAILLGSPDLAMAAQGGGRVGGRNFSSPAPSRTYSAPAQTYTAPTFSAPYYAPSPFGWSPFYNPGPTIVVGGGGFGFGGIFNFLLIGAVLMFVANAVTGFLSNSSDDGVFGATEKTSVVRLQVGLLGMARTLQRDLDRIADRADTNSPEGLHYILTETVLALLRHPDYCVYGRSSTDIERSIEKGEASFNRLSLEERGKFEQETLVSVGDVRRRVDRAPKAERFNSEYIVVTILVATEGEYKLPDVSSSTDLKQALTVLGSIPVDQLQAVEILWTPQSDEDTLSSQEMLADYPLLRSL